MPGLPEILPTCLIILIAATVRSTVGFGEALIAMPLLIMVIPKEQAAPLVALISVINGIGILIREWKHIEFRAALKLVLPAFVTVPVGVWLLRSGDDRIVKVILAVFILIFSSFSLRKPKQFHLESDHWAPLVGLFAGFLGGAYNTSGPPIVMYGTLRHWPPERFRAMLQSFFIFSSLWVVAIRFWNKEMTPAVLTYFAICLPFVFLAMWLGFRISKKVSVERFVVVVHVALLLIGTMLLMTALLPTTP